MTLLNVNRISAIIKIYIYIYCRIYYFQKLNLMSRLFNSQFTQIIASILSSLSIIVANCWLVQTISEKSYF